VTTNQRSLIRNLALDIVGAVGVGVTGALVSVLLPTIARRGGVDPIGLAALTAMPFVANMLSAYAGRIGPRTPGQLGLVRVAGAGALLLLVAWPLPPGMLLVVLVFMLSMSFSNPFQLRLWGALYPSRVLGRVLAVLGMSRAAAGAVAALAIGITADAFEVPAAIAATGAFGVVASVAYAGQRARSRERPPSYSPRESVRALLAPPGLRRALVAQLFFGGGLIAAAPLYALVHVDRLHLSLAEVGGIGIAISAATTASYPFWGMATDRLGPASTLRIGGVFGVASLAGYALAPTLALLLPAAIALGAANASIDVGLNAYVSGETTLANRAAAQAGWNGVTGVRGIAASFVMSALVTAGVTSVAEALLLCAGAAVVGAVLFFRLGPPALSRPEAAASEGAALEVAASDVVPNEAVEALGA
jgi:MFS transporter